jgi:transposase InsO family protein
VGLRQSQRLTYERIAERVGLSKSTVARACRDAGVARLPALQPATDNGSAYKSRRFARLLRRLGIKHIRTRPYTPRTNGKAERFIQTLLREWAYAFIYPSSNHRTAELGPWMHHYNWHRPHSAVSHQPPITRLGFDGNNVLRNYI